MRLQRRDRCSAIRDLAEPGRRLSVPEQGVTAKAHIMGPRQGLCFIGLAEIDRVRSWGDQTPLEIATYVERALAYHHLGIRCLAPQRGEAHHAAEEQPFRGSDLAQV